MSFSADTLHDRVAIVTGASQGIGRAIAAELAKVGAHMVACRATRPGAQAKEARKLVCSNLDGTERARCDETPDKLAALADAVRALDRLGAPHAVVGGVIDRAEPLDITGVRIRVVTTVDLIAMKERSKALRDQADIALLRGDVPDPDEDW